MLPIHIEIFNLRGYIAIGDKTSHVSLIHVDFAAEEVASSTVIIVVAVVIPCALLIVAIFGAVIFVRKRRKGKGFNFVFMLCAGS